MTYTPKTKTFLYKRASFLRNIGKETLQSFLETALLKFKQHTERQEQPSVDDPYYRWINFTQKSGRTAAGEMRCCEFVSITQGAHQGAIEFGTAAIGDLNIDELPAPQGKEYIEGSAYFGVFKNHLVLVQSSSLKTQDLERYLNWLLGPAKAGLLGEENQLALEDNVPPDDLTLNDATGILLDAPVNFQPVSGGEVIEEKRLKRLKSKQRSKKGAAENQSLEVTPSGGGWEAFKAFLGEKLDLPTRLNAEDMLKAGRMTVSLSLNWTNPRKEDGSDFARQIAHKLRHVTDEFDYSIKTRSGMYVGRETFKPEQKFSIPWSKVRPQFDVLFPKMLEWLENLRTSGKIASS